MSTDPNDYTGTWNEVMQRAKGAGVGKDDWQSRCARLSALALLSLCSGTMHEYGKDDVCYRLTGRAVRLRSLLGMSVAASAYPSVRYHATKPPVTVKDEQGQSLGEGVGGCACRLSKRPS